MRRISLLSRAVRSLAGIATRRQGGLRLIVLPVIALAVVASLAGLAFSRSEQRRTQLASGSHVAPIPPLPPHPGARLAPLSAKQRAQAIASRAAYRGVSARQALALARQPAGVLGLAAKSFYQPLMLRKGERVIRYVNSREALVREPAAPRTRKDPGIHYGNVVVARSTLPMEVGSGQQAKQVDLSLKRTSAGLVPTTPLVPIRISPGALSFITAGVSVKLQDARPSALEALGRQGFQASVLPDTDLAAQPLASGAEQWLQLRSPASPEAFRFSVSLPAGGKLELQADGRVLAKRGKQTLLTVLPATATDALGRPLTARLEVKGSIVTLVVPHRANKQVSYPVAVDPIYLNSPCGIRHVQDPYQFIDSECGQGSTGAYQSGNPETFAQWQYYAFGQAFGNAKNQFAGPGLYVWSLPGTNYSTGNAAEFAYFAPPGAFIQRVDYYNTSHANWLSGGSSWMFEGIYDPNPPGQWQPLSTYEYATNTTVFWGNSPYLIGATRNGGSQETYVGNSTIPPNPDGAVPVSNVQGANGNAAVFGLEIATTGTRTNSALDLAFMQGATIWLYDYTPPTITSAAPAAINTWTDDANKTYTVTPDAWDNTTSTAGLGMKTFALVTADAVTGSLKGTPQIVTNPCTGDHTGVGYCPQHWSTIFNYQLPEGVNNVGVGAYDATNNASSQVVKTKIDRTPPTLALNGSLYAARQDSTNQGGTLTGLTYPLTVNATDSYSGVAEIDVQVDNHAPTVYDGNCTTTPATSAGCDTSQTATYLFNNELYPAGQHTITVKAKDWLGTSRFGQPGLTNHITTQQFVITTQPPIPLGQTQPQSQLQSDTLGLEKFYDYRTIHTGAGSSLNVNLGTGNAVWSWTPVINPGQGLASFVQVTYNSQQRVSDLNLLNQTPSGTILNNTGYNQAGYGFSVGIDGLTRLNEPLDLSQAQGDAATGIAGQISFTDIDGTRHTFIKDASGNWIAPPGVFLHLRQWNAYNPADSTTWDKVWAITCPNGVTFFFDYLGYESAMQDRTGNMITYNRTLVTNPLTALLGQTITTTLCKGPVTSQALATLSGILGLGCVEQTTAVTDQGGRQLRVCYYDTSAEPGCPGPPVKPLDNRLLKVEDIIDHAGHVLQFNYDSTTGNYLTSLTQSATESANRTFQFGYRGPQPALGAIQSLAGIVGLDKLTSPLFPQTLTSITDPRASVHDPSNGGVDSQPTTISYNVAPVTGANLCPIGQTSSTVTQAVASLLNLEPTCVSMVAARDGGATTFAYQTGTDASHNLIHTTTVTGPQTDQNANAETWTDTTDASFRPIKQVDPLGRETDTTWNDVNSTQTWCPTGQTQPANTTANAATGLLAAGAAGTAIPVMTNYCYEPNGQMTEQQGPFNQQGGESATFRDTKITYNESQGTLLAPAGDSGQFVTDESKKDVSTGTTTQTTNYSFDPVNPADGLVTKVTDPNNQAWTIDYYPGPDGKIQDGGGLIKDKIDPLLNKTVYGSSSVGTQNNGYDPNGLPTQVFAPSQSVPTTYQYDADGNLLAVTDPRNPNPASLGGANPTPSKVKSPYTTYHAYDSLGQQTDTWVAKDTIPGTSSVWIHNTTSYDPNGNVQSRSVGDDGSTPVTTTNYQYTAADQRSQQTVMNVRPTENSPGQSGQVTSWCHDLNGDVTDQVLPAGQPSGHPASCPLGATITDHAVHYLLDADGEVLVKQQVAAALGALPQLTSYAYDARGNRIATADPVNNAGATLLQAAQNAAAAYQGQFTTWRSITGYDSANEPIATNTMVGSADGRFNTNVSQYDAVGNLIATESPKAYAVSGYQVPPVYAPSGQFQLSGQPGVTTYAYDGRNLLTSTTDPNGNKTEYARQTDGKICAVISPNGTALSSPPKDDCTAGTSANPQYYKTTYSYYPEGWLQTIGLPTAPGEYSYNTPLQVSYDRSDMVGDPVTITDPRGTKIQNTFYSTGDLKSTDHPWWWTYDPNANQRGPDPNTGGQGQLTGDTPSQGQIREKSLAAIFKQNSSPRTPPLPSDGAAGNFGEVPAQALPGILPTAGPTSFTYDGHMWLTTVTDAESVLAVPASASTTQLSYDPNGQLTTLNEPFDGSSTMSATSYTYDPDGNKLTATTPSRASLPTADPNAASPPGAAGAPQVAPVTTYTYDGLDRLSTQVAPGTARSQSAPSASTQTTTYCYYLAPPQGEATINPGGASACPATQTSGAPIQVTEPNGVSYLVAQRVQVIDAGNNGARHQTNIDYDALGNQLAVTDPLGNVTSYQYDEIGNKTATVRPLGQNPSGTPNAQYVTTSNYDLASRLTDATDGSGSKTTYTYDQNGNLTQQINPGAQSAQNGSLTAQVTGYAYNGRGLPWKTTTGTGTDQRTTVTETDGNGNPIRTVNPAGTDTSGTPYNTYAGDYTSSSGPADPPTTEPNPNLNAVVRVFDENNQLRTGYLPWGCNQAANTAKAPCDPTTVPDKRRFKIDYNATTTATDGGMDRLASSTLAYDWTASNPTKWTASYTYQPNGWLFTLTPPSTQNDTGSRPTTYTYDPAGDQIQASTKGSTSTGVMTRASFRSYWPDGQPQLVDGQGNGSLARHHYYFYEPTGQLSQVRSISSSDGNAIPGGELDQACYDQAGRLASVDQTINPNTQNPPPGSDTVQTYDGNGNVTVRLTNGSLGASGCPQISQTGPPPSFTGGQQTLFAYTNLDQEHTMTVSSNAGAGQPQPSRSYTTDYWPSGQRKDQTRSQSGGGSLTENWFYNTAGQLSQDVRSSDGKNQTYGYDTNGNRTGDERGTHQYNALDQEIQWTRGGNPNTANPGSVVTYTHDGTGALVQQTTDVTNLNVPLGGLSATVRTQTTTRYCSDQTGAPQTLPGQTPPLAADAAKPPYCELDAGRAEAIQTTATTTANAGGTPINVPGSQFTIHNCYDQLGQQVLSDRNPDVCSTPTPNAQYTSRYNHTAFGQLASSTTPYPTQLNTSQTITDNYVYDALGRRYQKTENLSGQAATPTTYGYLGLSTAVSTDHGVTANGAMYNNTYDYNASTNRVGLYTIPNGSTSGNYYSYAADANGSVEGLEGANAQVAANNQYHYTPYGELELGTNQGGGNLLGNQNPDSQLSQDAQANQNLYEGFLYNAGADTYSTPARDYSPSQSAYLTPDTFEQSSASQALLTGSSTQSPYTFAAGNPTSLLEIDGHDSWWCGSNPACNASYAINGAGTPRSAASQGTTAALEGCAQTGAAGACQAAGAVASNAQSAQQQRELATILVENYARRQLGNDLNAQLRTQLASIVQGAAASTGGGQVLLPSPSALATLWTRSQQIASQTCSDPNGGACSGATVHGRARQVFASLFVTETESLNTPTSSGGPPLLLDAIIAVGTVECPECTVAGGIAEALGLSVGADAADGITVGSLAAESGAGARSAETVFSGHGGIQAADEATTVVPKGTCIRFYCSHGETISDTTGNAIETGHPPAAVETFGPGETVPNYWLEPPTGLNIMGNPFTVSAPTRLSDLLGENMGTCHWAACRSVVP